MRSDEPPAAVPVIAAIHLLLGALDEPAQLVASALRSVDRQIEWVSRTLGLVNAAIRAHRAEVSDPYFSEITLADARAVRIGIGTCGDLLRGVWTQATEVRLRRPVKIGRFERSRAGEVVSAQLRGAAMSLCADEHRLRALMDLEQGRVRSAMLELRCAISMLRCELDAVVLADLEIGVGRKLAVIDRQLADMCGRLREPAGAEEPTAEVEVLWEIALEIGGLMAAWRTRALRRDSASKDARMLENNSKREATHVG